VLATLKRYAKGEVPLGRVFLNDMLIFGTIVNVVTGGAALISYASDVPGWLALSIFLLPVPYNVALCVFVWRSAARSGSGWADLARVGSVLWLVMFLVV
jgi:hypothetical protein